MNRDAIIALLEETARRLRTRNEGSLTCIDITMLCGVLHKLTGFICVQVNATIEGDR
jgi:uncharacterized membrane protein